MFVLTECGDKGAGLVATANIAPGILLIAIVALIAARFVYAATTFLRVALLSGSTSRTLGEGSERHGDVLMFDSNPRLNICLFACFDAQRRRFERPERPFPRALCRPPGPFRPPP